VSHEFWSLAEGAGWVAARTNDEFLREKVRSTDMWDQLFAIRALRTERRGPSVEEGSARQRGIEEELRRACDLLRNATDERLAEEGRLCRGNLLPSIDVGDPKSSRRKRGNRTGILETVRGGKSLPLIDGGGLGTPPPPARNGVGTERGR
jgi:hypothetical protein